MRISRVLSLSLPPSIYKVTKQIANEEGRTFSELIREALRQYIENREWKKLQKYGVQKAKQLRIKKEDVEKIITEYRRQRKDG